MASGGGSGGNDESGGSSWWGSLMKTAKEKSKNALDIIKTDLAEFTSTMSSDTNYLINQASAQLKEISSQHLNEDKTREKSENLLSSNSNNNNNSEEKVGLTTIHDRYKNELENLQSSQNTYLNDPDQTNSTSNSEFKDWKANFSSESCKSEISELLIQNGAMRLLYSQLVPAQLTNEEFWSRYFYKVYLLQEENKKRVKLLERASNQVNKENNEQESFDWEDEEEHSKDKKAETSKEDLKNQHDISENKSELKLSECLIENENKNENSGSDLDLTLNENENLVASDSSDAIVEKDLTDSNKLHPTKSETNLKPEESDEWDRVSDVGSEKKDRHSDSASEASDTGTISNVKSENKTEGDNKGKANKNKNSSKKLENKIEKEKEKSNDEWDNWDE